MHLALFTFALQLGLASSPLRPVAQQSVDGVADSIRDLRRARSVQGSFEYARRSALPLGGGSNGRCDVNLGRFCWWYDERPVVQPKEAGSISRHRAALIAELDSIASRRPGDEWIAGMRVYYRMDAGRPSEADSVARDCRAAAWWCLALTGYARHQLGQIADAESAFAAALDSMPETERCAWRDIAPLLPSRTRRRYERASCEERQPIEVRYWLLSRPRLTAPANEWRTEFYVRRVLSRLARRAATPQAGGWGKDSEELVLRYGWPVSWSRLDTPTGLNADIAVVGHDPTPSFAFAPDEALLDTSTNAASDDAWDLGSRAAESRFAPRLMTRAARVSSQLARFRRGDSVVLAAAYAVRDDSLSPSSSASVGATLPDGRTLSFELGGGLVGRGVLRLPRSPRLAGVEIADTTRRTLARSRELYPDAGPDSGLAMSDLLLHRSTGSQPATLEEALILAIPGDTASRARPIGVFWEAYGIAGGGDSLDVAVTVERIDRSWIRGARQRLRLASPDSPVRLKWHDARPPAAGPAARSISLDLANLEPGRYRVSVSLSRAGSTRALASREMRLQER